MKIGALTPTRGDRSKLLDFCRSQFAKMSLPPGVDSVHLIVGDEPKGKQMDLVWRIRKGLDVLKKLGCDLVFIMEDDDYYPADYFWKYLKAFEVNKGFDIAGDPETIYYNIKTRRYSIINHKTRASLFTTCINLNTFPKDFEWPADDSSFFDVNLWARYEGVLKKFMVRGTGAVGIKHGIGKCGGNGHRFELEHLDANWSYLYRKVDLQSFIFYKNLFEDEL